MLWGMQESGVSVWLVVVMVVVHALIGFMLNRRFPSLLTCVDTTENDGVRLSIGVALSLVAVILGYLIVGSFTIQVLVAVLSSGTIGRFIGAIMGYQAQMLGISGKAMVQLLFIESAIAVAMMGLTILSFSLMG